MPKHNLQENLLPFFNSSKNFKITSINKKIISITSGFFFQISCKIIKHITLQQKQMKQNTTINKIVIINNTVIYQI